MNWKNVVGAIGAACALVIFTVVVVRPVAVSELVGLAVAQTNTQWNSVVDASKGDGLGSGILGTNNYLFNGLTFDRMRSIATSDAASATGILGMGVQVFNGATYDRLRGGLAADASAATGLISNQPFGFNGTTYDRIRSSLAADGNAATGILDIAELGFNGSTWDRLKTASATNNTATTSTGALQTVPLSTWSVTNTVTGAAQATASKATGGGTVRHVATSITICGGDTVVAAPRQINLRDGATGAGTIIRSWWIGIAVTNDTKCIDLAPINMTGTANTAMTLEFAGAGSATSSSTVTLTGYSTP